MAASIIQGIPQYISSLNTKENKVSAVCFSARFASTACVFGMTVGLSLPAIGTIGLVNLTPFILTRIDILKPCLVKAQVSFNVLSALALASLCMPTYTALAFFELAKGIITSLLHICEDGSAWRNTTISIGYLQKYNITMSNACIFSWSRATLQQKNYTKANILFTSLRSFSMIPLFGYSLPLVSALEINILLTTMSPVLTIERGSKKNWVPLKSLLSILLFSSSPFLYPLGISGISSCIEQIQQDLLTKIRNST